MSKKLLIIAMLVLAGCGTTDIEDTSQYIGLQEAWDSSTIEDQARVCLAIDEDPSIVASTSEDTDADAAISEAFFNDVCP